MCWVSTFSFRDSEKALAFSLSPYDPKGVKRAKNDAKRCEIQFNFQKYTSQNDSTNNYRFIKKNIYSISWLRTHGLSYANSVCPVATPTTRHRRFVVFSLMVKSGFELGTPRWHSTALSTEPLEPPTPLTKRCFSSLAPLLILKTYFDFDLNSWPIFKFGPIFVCFVFWVIRTDIHTPKNNNLSIKIEEKNFAYSTRCSQAVTHPSTNRARRCLTSVIGRELVCSTWYGRRYWIELTSRHMLNLKCRLKLSSPARFRTLHPL